MKAPEFTLIPKQDEALELIATSAMYVLLYGGARSTKTFTAVWIIVWRAISAPKSRHAILRFRFSHVKSSIVYDTFPKVMALCFPDCPYNLNKSDWFVTFPNGSEIWFGGLDDKERSDKILGNEYATVLLNEISQITYGSFLTLITRLAQSCTYETVDGEVHDLTLKYLCDENPPSKGHWSYKLFIEKKDPISGSLLENPEDYASLLMNPRDNIENLPEAYVKALQLLPKRKRDRFWEGIFVDDSENALWSSDTLDKNRVTEIPEGVDLVRVVVAVDPSGADGESEETSDDIGIGVAALGSDGIGYVLEDLTLNAGPAKWGKVVASAYERHEADRVIAETNFGGAMVESTIKTANPSISYKGVTASRGKVIRAEPISALHETGKIKFVGRFDKLEDELMAFTTTGYIGEKSPNRADWFIWAMTELFPGMTKKPKKEIDYSVPNLKRL